MEVVDTMSYKAILGVDFLIKANAVMEMAKEQMMIKTKGIQEEVQLTLQKEVQGSYVTQP